jgi:hypothetical protein
MIMREVTLQEQALVVQCVMMVMQSTLEQFTTHLLELMWLGVQPHLVQVFVDKLITPINATFATYGMTNIISVLVAPLTTIGALVVRLHPTIWREYVSTNLLKATINMINLLIH